MNCRTGALDWPVRSGLFLHCFTLARRIGCVSIVMATLLSGPPLRTETSATSAQSVEGVPAVPFVAQAVGLEWLNPLRRRDYPTEWQLLWTLGLVKPNANDDMVRTDRTRFGARGFVSTDTVSRGPSRVCYLPGHLTAFPADSP